MKKILFSLMVIGMTVAIVVMGTNALFSDTETSTGNTFTAGAIDLQVDSQATYNGQSVSEATWQLKDLVPTADKFFNFADVKPGDYGENTISLHIINNDAWVCAEVSNLTNFENGQTEPEALVDATTGTNDGELQNAMVWTVWRDDGAGSGVAGDNIQNGTEQTLASGHPINGVLPIYDSTTGTGVLPGGATAYLGVSWGLPSATGNEVQTDGMTGDISFNVVQARNNNNFVCGKHTPTAECSASTTCGSTCTYGGVTYNTVLIGNQCWFKENLNVGIMIGNLETPDDTPPTYNDPSTVQKWCFDDSSTNCTNEGGLYTWTEAIGLANSCGTTYCNVPSSNQGICPTGWHIPTDAEFYTLENYLTTPGEACDPTRADWGCSDAGNKLVLGGSSGFDAIGAGNHETNGALSFFDKREPSIHLISSSPFPLSGGMAYGRSLIGGTGSPFVYRGWGGMVHGGSVRCLADTTENGLPSIVQDNFNSYSNGSIIGQGSWNSYVNGDNFLVQGDTVREGSKALHNYTVADSVATKYGTPLSDGRQIIFVRTEGRASWGLYPDGNTQVRVSKGPWANYTSIFAAVSFKTDGNVAYYDSVNDVYQNFATYNDNEWVKLEIEWRSSDATARYRVNDGIWTSWYTFAGSGSFINFDNVGVAFDQPSGSGGVYFDTLY